MNKEKFISELRKKLKRLPKKEVDNIISYYIEYFDDADKSEEEVLKELDSPSTIASQILADYAVNETKENNNKGYINKIIFAILAICAAPIAFPLGIAAIALVFALGVVGVVFFVVCGLVTLALILSGIGLFIGGTAVIITSPLTGIFYIGVSLLVVGISMLLVIGIKKVGPSARQYFNNAIKTFIETK